MRLRQDKFHTFRRRPKTPAGHGGKGSGASRDRGPSPEGSWWGSAGKRGGFGENSGEMQDLGRIQGMQDLGRTQGNAGFGSSRDPPTPGPAPARPQPEPGEGAGGTNRPLGGHQPRQPQARPWHWCHPRVPTFLEVIGVEAAPGHFGHHPGRADQHVVPGLVPEVVAARGNLALVLPVPLQLKGFSVQHHEATWDTRGTRR